MNQFEYTIHKQTPTGTVEHQISLEEISADERAGKNKLGEATGIDLSHCIYLGARHGENFLEQVKYYYVNPEILPPNAHLMLRILFRTQRDMMRVEFYGEKR